MRRTVMLVMLLAALWSVASCSGESTTTESGPIGGGPIASSADDTTAKVSDDPLDWVPSEPVRPRDEKTRQGAIAFASYVPLVSYYALGTGNANALTKIADRSTCQVCRTVSQNVVKLTNAKAIEVRNAPLTVDGAKVTNVDGDFFTVAFDVTYPSGGYVNPKTGHIYERLDRSDRRGVANLRWVDDGWQLLDYEVKEK